MKTPSNARAGFTLHELMIGSALSMIVVSAAFVFAQKETRSLGLTANSLEMTQSSRTMIDLLADDLKHAGTGIGPRLDGSFPGLLAGTFAVNGVNFNSLSTFNDDIGIVLADGARSTIADFSFGGGGQVCAGAGFNAGELAVMRTEDNLAFRTVRIDGLTPATCTQGQCVGGCQAFTWSAQTAVQSDAAANMPSYLGGQLAGGLKTLVWFVDATSSTLRRASFDGTTTCTARDATCGVLMADNAETIHTQVWRWNETTSAWVLNSSGPFDGTARLRVDVELVLRGRVAADRATSPVVLRLEAGRCLPGCTTRDRTERSVLRTSVEVKNSGRMRIR